MEKQLPSLIIQGANLCPSPVLDVEGSPRRRNAVVTKLERMVYFRSGHYAVHQSQQGVEHEFKGLLGRRSMFFSRLCIFTYALCLFNQFFCLAQEQRLCSHRYKGLSHSQELPPQCLCLLEFDFSRLDLGSTRVKLLIDLVLKVDRIQPRYESMSPRSINIPWTERPCCGDIMIRQGGAAAEVE